MSVVRGPGRFAMVAVVLTLATACGTTVPYDEGTLGVPGSISTTPGGAAAPGMPDEQGSAPGAGANALPNNTAGGVAPSAGSAQVVPGSAAAGANSASSGASSSGKTSSGPIKLGFLTNSCSQCAAYFGGGSIGGAQSEEETTRALITNLNLQGGIAGRKIEPTFHEFDLSRSFTAQYQEACSKFTEDAKVVAVVGFASTWSQLLATCLNKHDTLWLDAGNEMGDLTQLKGFPNLYNTNGVSYDGIVHSGLESALLDGWMTKKSRIGVIRGGCNYQMNAYKNTAVPFFKKHGLNVVVDTVYNRCFDGADVATFGGYIEGAVLKMRSNDVDVVFSPPVESLIFSLNADRQAYYPRYVSYGAGGAAGEGIFSERQASNWHSAGWLPGLDLNPSQQPAQNATQKQCLAMAKSSGVDVGPDKYNFYADCDALLVYKRAVEAAGGDTSLPAVSAGIESLGTSYKSASLLTGTTQVGNGRRTFPVSYRANTYNTACSCFQYSGPIRKIGIQS